MTQLLDLLLLHGDFSRHLCEMLGYICLSKLSHVSMFAFLSDELDWLKAMAYDEEGVDWGARASILNSNHFFYKQSLPTHVYERLLNTPPLGVIFHSKDGHFCCHCNVRHRAFDEHLSSPHKVLLMNCHHEHFEGCCDDTIYCRNHN